MMPYRHDFDNGCEPCEWVFFAIFVAVVVLAAWFA